MLYVAIATRAFRRYSTYVLATAAGIFTNCVFGIISCFVYMAVWEQRPDAGGYDVTDALTYVWLGQAMLMTVGMFGGGSPDDLADRIRSGDVVIDFYRPVGLLGWYLAADLGRAAYHLLTRGVGPAIVGALLFDLRSPGGPFAWVAFMMAVLLAVVVSFAMRMLVAITSFWLFDEAGPRTVLIVMNSFFTGLTVPLVLFPGALRDLAMAMPWAAMLQIPADIWLGQRAGAQVWLGLGFAAAWSAALMLACAVLLRVAERRVVVQGG